jgi:patatin-like phospholipase/acyl hydrolase
MSETIRVLSIDGGGIRGLIPAMILDQIERTTGKPISQLFHLIAGTSTGGILAMGLVKPDAAGKPQFSAADMMGLYEDKGPIIFARSAWDKIHSGFGLTNEKYPAAAIEGVLQEFFDDVLLSQVLTEVVIPSYEIEQRECYFFKSRKAKSDLTDNFLLRQVARATSAAPTYFSPCRIYLGGDKPPLALVDGGVFANNPTLCGFAEAKRIYGQATDFLVVSLGTGQLTRKIPYDEAQNWGLLGWAPHIVSVFADGMLDTVDYQMNWLLPPNPRRYYRFQTELTLANDDMDDASAANLDDLKAEAHKIMDTCGADLEVLCRQLAA